MRLRYILMIFPLMGAIACAMVGGREYVLSAQSSQEPEEISLRDLIKRGPRGNPNIILKDFTILEDYVYNKKLVTRRWTKVWVPIIPTDGDDPPGKPAIHAFLYSENVGSDMEVRQRFGHPKLRCLVNPKAPKPGIIGSVLIERSYPGTNPDNCLILEEGKEPASLLKLGLYVAGVVLLLGAIGGIWFLGRLWDKIPVDAEKPDEGWPDRRRSHERAEPVIDVLPADDDDRDRPLR